MIESLANLLKSFQGFYMEAESDLDTLRENTLTLVFKAIELKLKEEWEELKSGK